MAEVEHESSTGNKVVGFECNICFDLAQDPVITRCGHLHCWPCLYKWLRVTSHSGECPVCKALIQEEKLVPIYGRGTAPSEPRTKPGTGMKIPSRPTGQRPQTAPAPAAGDDSFSNGAAFSNFGMLARFGGVLSPVLSVQFQGFLDSGYSSGFDYGYLDPFHEPEGGLHLPATHDKKLKKILKFLLAFLLFALLTL